LRAAKAASVRQESTKVSKDLGQSAAADEKALEQAERTAADAVKEMEQIRGEFYKMKAQVSSG
jgi:hypothetical protein